MYNTWIVIQIIPKLTTVHVVKKEIKDPIQIPVKGSISKNMITLTIMTGKTFPDFNMLTL